MDNKTGVSRRKRVTRRQDYIGRREIGVELQVKRRGQLRGGVLIVSEHILGRMDCRGRKCTTERHGGICLPTSTHITDEEKRPFFTKIQCQSQQQITSRFDRKLNNSTHARKHTPPTYPIVLKDAFLLAEYTRM